MYAPLVRPGGIVALHDIAVTADNSGRGFDVATCWTELARDARTIEILDPAGAAGLRTQLEVPPDRRRPATLGFGLVLK